MAGLGEKRLPTPAGTEGLARPIEAETPPPMQGPTQPLPGTQSAVPFKGVTMPGAPQGGQPPAPGPGRGEQQVLGILDRLQAR